MKKNYLLGVALMALTWTSCTQDDSLNLVGEDNSVFTGEMEFVGSRTSLGEDNKISWVLEDELSIFKKNNINRKYKVASIDNGKATFSYLDNVTPATVEAISANYAVYPYSENNSITSNGTISAPIKAEYEFTSRSSFISSALLASTTTGTNFSFKNVQGYLRLRLCAEIPEDYAAVESVTLTSDSKKLSGIAEITWSTDGIPSAAIKNEGAGNSLTVKLSTPQSLPSKASGNYLELYVPVVPMTFDPNEVSLTINFEGGESYTKKNSSAITISRREVTGVKLTVGVDDNFTGDMEGFEEVWDGETQTIPDPVTDPATGEEYYPVVKGSDLAGLAALINGTATSRAAEDYSKIQIRLMGDFDLGGAEWTPIGTSEKPYKGIFDGNGYTIKNLVVTGYKSNVGLFGNTHNGEIKNLTVENAKVSGRLAVGVVAGQPYTSKYTNITVKGHVEVNGMAYVGGVGGRNAYANWENITVDVDATSYVKANSVENGTAYRTYVGGVVGFNGEGGHSFKNITSNIDVTGSTIDVGGLFGIAHYGNNFENCVCTGDVEITNAAEEADAQEIGGIAGVWMNSIEDQPVTFTNCKFEGELKVNNNFEINTDKFGKLVCAAYYSDGKGKLIIDGVEYMQTAKGVIVIDNGVIKVANAADFLNAFNYIEDNYTIQLTGDVIFDENNRMNNGGSWYEGLLYDGDKSFTLDLNDKTITNDEFVNDYLLYFKNNGDKANTITIKNGTITAGSSAYAAIATASSNAQKITMNLEDVSINGNNSNGAVVKFRGGGELNVKAGTIVNGNDNYVGIEVYGTETVANIYEGVEIYQKGTNSYVGGIIGASGNATLNVYGGKGVSAKCGLIVMSSGGTINVEGGEWMANTDGTPKDDNFGVLVSQFDNATYPDAINSVINVTGGTFKGGYNCYGNVADKAFIKISGGNFNADPTNYVVAGYEVSEVSGIYTVSKPKAQIALEKAIEKGGNVTLTEDVNLATALNIESGDITIDLDGKTITATSTSAFEVKNGAKLTLKNGNITSHEAIVRAIGGEVVIGSGKYVQTGTAVGSTPATYRYGIDVREGGKATIIDGEFESGNGMLNVNSGCELIINGGKFTNNVEKSMTRHFAYVSGKITINDGEFYGVANSAAGGCFFCGAAAGCDIQIKGGKFTSLWTSGSVNRIFESYYGGTITVTGGMFNTNGGIADFVTANTDEATKDAYPYVAK